MSRSSSSGLFDLTPQLSQSLAVPTPSPGAGGGAEAAKSGCGKRAVLRLHGVSVASVAFARGGSF